MKQKSSMKFLVVVTVMVTVFRFIGKADERPLIFPIPQNQ